MSLNKEELWCCSSFGPTTSDMIFIKLHQKLTWPFFEIQWNVHWLLKRLKHGNINDCKQQNIPDEVRKGRKLITKWLLFTDFPQGLLGICHCLQTAMWPQTSHMDTELCPATSPQSFFQYPHVSSKWLHIFLKVKGWRSHVLCLIACNELCAISAPLQKDHIEGS